MLIWIFAYLIDKKKFLHILALLAAFLILDYKVIHLVRTIQHAFAVSTQVAPQSNGMVWVPFPYYYGGNSNSINYTATAFNLRGSSTFAEVMQIPKTGSLCNVDFRIGSEPGATSALDIWLENMGANTSSPAGTSSLIYTNANAEIVTTPAANTWEDLPLVASGTVTQGQILAVAFSPSSTATTSVNFDIAGQNDSKGFYLAFPYEIDQATSGQAWTKRIAQIFLGLKYCDGSFAEQLGVPAMSNASNLNFNSTTVNGNTVGIKFTSFRVPMTVHAYSMWLTYPNTNQYSGIAELVDNGGNILASSAINTANNLVGASMLGYFSTDTVLAANTTTYFVVKNTSSTNMTMSIFSVVTTASSNLNTYGLGTSTALVQGTGTTNWTVSSTWLPFMSIGMNYLDNGVAAASGGGGGGPTSWWSDGF